MLRAPRTTVLRSDTVTGSTSSLVDVRLVDVEGTVGTGSEELDVVEGIGVTLAAEVVGINVGGISVAGVADVVGIKGEVAVPLPPGAMAATPFAFALSLIKMQLPAMESRDEAMVIMQSSNSTLPPARMAKMA